MAELSVQAINEDGVEPTYSAAESGGDTYPNNSDRVFLHVKNGDTADHTVTIAAQVSQVERPGYGTLDVPDISVTVPSGGAAFIGPVPRNAYGRKPDIQYDAITSMTIAALEV